MKVKDTNINGKQSLCDLVESRGEMQSVKNHLFYYGFKDGIKFDDIFSKKFLAKYSDWSEFERKEFAKVTAGVRWKQLKSNIENHMEVA